jgi:hypothetical protein
MRHLLFMHLVACAVHASAQYDQFSHRYNYAFVEDSSALVPLRGSYLVDLIARGQHWSYVDPRTPVDHPGERRTLKPVIKVNGEPVMVVELEKNYQTPDNKLRVVRGADTMIVDLMTFGNVEERMLKRTAALGVPPRPPFLLPFRKGWYTDGELILEPHTVFITERFDALWALHSNEVLALYDTARYEFDLMTNGLEIGPIERTIMRDPNYERHLLQFPASGPGVYFELYRQDSVGVASTTMSLRVEMPADGETGQWVDITDLPYGKYSTYLKWKDQQSLFDLILGW